MMNRYIELSQKVAVKVLLTFLILVMGLSIIPLHHVVAEDTDNGQIIVSLGDSYSSGEGIEPFYGQDEDIAKKINNPDWIAHRSQKAWSGMLTLPSVSGKMSDHRDQNWFFYAASGAKTEHMNNEFQKPFNKEDGKYNGSYPLLPQLTAFDNLKGKHAKYVTLTLGGNDADFGGIITTSVMSNSYLNPNGLSNKLNYTWQEFFKSDGIRDNLYHTYGDIAKKAGPQAHIIVAGYPKLIAPEGDPGHGTIISKKEAALINENVTKFNQAIHSVVNTCQREGMQISFVSVEDAFEGHGVYSKEPYINDIYFGSHSQDIKDDEIASAYSVHPNEDGAHAYAKCVQQRIDELEGKSDGTYNNKFSVSVIDRNNTFYDNYKIQISGKEYSGFFNIPILNKNYSKTIDVSSSKEEKITLPNGEYTITVSDASDESKTSSKDIKIRSESKNDYLIFKTDFGEEKHQTEEKVNGPYTYIGSPTYRGGKDEKLVVYQYDIDTGKRVEVFRLNVSDVFGKLNSRYFTYSHNLDRAVHYKKYAFDSKMNKLAVEWHADDGSSRVGWVDKSGNLTDVTSVVYPDNVSLNEHNPYDKSTEPNCEFPIFSSDTEFVFYDYKKNKYVYVDTNTLKVIKEKKSESYDGEIMPTYVTPDGELASLSSSWKEKHLPGEDFCDLIDENTAISTHYVNKGFDKGVEKDVEKDAVLKYDIRPNANHSIPQIVLASLSRDDHLGNCAYHDGLIAFTGEHVRNNNGLNESFLYLTKDGEGEQEVKRIAPLLRYDETLLCWK